MFSPNVVTFSAETYEQDSLRRTDRPYYSDGEPFFATDDLPASVDGTPDDGVVRIYSDQRINLLTFGGLVDPGIGAMLPSLGIGAFPDGNFYQFDTNSNLVQYMPGDPSPGSPFFALGGDGEDFFDLVDQLQSPLTRDVFTGSMNYDLTDSVRVYSNLLYANTQATELVLMSPTRWASSTETGPTTIWAS